MSGLPAALAPWAQQLSVLYADVALALGPWVRRITELLTADDLATAAGGVPDGYDGLSTRGDPSRMLVLEWLLAAELPDEFLRRAATGELTYLSPATLRPAHSGTVVAVVDCGPLMWGAPRLAQLATLLVLHRQAAVRGASFELHVLGPGRPTAYGGGLDQLVRSFVKARGRSVPDPALVLRLLADLPEQTWLLTAPGVASEVGHRRTVAYEEGTWTDTGVADVRVSYHGRRFVLPMPPQDIAVRVLRGKGFAAPPSAARTAATTKVDAAWLRLPVFPDGTPVLLARGDDDHTVVSAPLLEGRLRRHRFSRPVLSAWRQGRRVLALIAADGGRIRLEVAGKPLPELAGSSWPRDGLTCDPEGPLRPVYVHGGGLLAELGGRWWRLTRAGEVEPSDVVAARSRPVGGPLLARSVDGLTRIGDQPKLPRLALLAPDEAGSFAWSCDDGSTWTTSSGHEFRPSGELLGVTVIGGELSAIALSPGGHIVRQVTEHATRALTRWSHGGPRPSLHPNRPWLAFTQRDGVVAVADLDANRVLREWRQRP
ncbi:hypothetical protein CS0771_46070 [Catellatospora sp. IY07-71]|uniref:hypothetical protein n=1 Tax=Catellatospora sp. IY07-71 TaxID=2728827 RepID=UPI001BB3A3B3|nr:hypothetical protein [Catellatospora sp. IY07-71]BCJ75063.1 hypothetical protein CS0771_46070 [Catellatospora sp. IY07-71]